MTCRALLWLTLVLIVAGCTGQASVNPVEAHNAGIFNLTPSDDWQIQHYADVRYPGGVAAGAKNFVYVASYKTNRVTRIAPDGSQSKVGSGFKGPFGVASYHNYVYVADSLHSTVKKVSPDGVISIIASGGEPMGIDADSSGNVYFTDFVSGTVSKISPKGSIRQIVGPPTCEWPIAVTVDSTYNVYVICGTKAIIKVTPAGTVSEVGSGWQNPMAIAVDAKSNLYVLQRKDGLFEYTPDGVLSQIATNKQIPNAKGVSFRNGALYVSSFAKDMIVKLTQ